MTTNSELQSRRMIAVPQGVVSAAPIFVDRAENASLWDVEGREYIDFAGGIAVLNTGHRHPKILAAVRAQLDRLTHSAFQVAAYEPYIELTEKLNAIAPVEGEAKTILLTTGAEAVENAVKIARAATGRSAIIAFTGGFHGRTMLTMGLTGKVAPYKQQFGSMPAAIYHAPFPIPGYGVDVTTSIAYLDHIFRADVGPEHVAAILIEPVQGEGGFNRAPAELMQHIRSLCDSYGILLIADEIQTGFGRTGKMFAMQHYDIRPDIVTMAKSLAGGFPLAAVTGRTQCMNAVLPGGLGGTFGGSPISCAAALAVIDVIHSENLLHRAEELGNRTKAFLKEVGLRNNVVPIANIRGDGSMIAFDILTGHGSAGKPDGAAAKQVTKRALECGLILLSCGNSGETIRLLYPLTIQDDIFEQGLVRLAHALQN